MKHSPVTAKTIYWCCPHCTFATNEAAYGIIPSSTPCPDCGNVAHKFFQPQYRHEIIKRSKPQQRDKH